MTIRVDSQGKLSGIEGWDDAVCEELTGGLTNRTWKVSLGDRAGVLKLDETPRSEPFNARLAEAQVQRIAAKHGLAPGVLYVDRQLISPILWQATPGIDPASISPATSNYWLQHLRNSTHCH